MPEGAAPGWHVVVDAILVGFVEVLNALIRRADSWSLFEQLATCVITHRAALYVDHLIMFIEPKVGDIETVMEIFNLFKGVSGLGCNLGKCQLAPIRCSLEQVELAINLFPCSLVQFLIKYLGAPLSITKLLKSALQLLVDKMANKLPTWKGNLMNHSGHLALIKTILSAMSVYTAIILSLPPWLLRAFKKTMRVFLWTGSETIQSEKCQLVWSRMQHPL
jgi:hypothetical protein